VDGIPNGLGGGCNFDLVAGLGIDLAEGPTEGAPDPGAPGRVAAIFERSPAGEAALREGAELANTGHLLAVVTLAPQARAARLGLAGGEGPYNVAVRQEATLDLQQARELLGSVAERATFNMLAGCPQPRLAEWVSEHGFGIVLLPRHRFTSGGNFFARNLRRKTTAEIRLVG
jgi:hypothetical protein